MGMTAGLGLEAMVFGDWWMVMWVHDWTTVCEVWA